MKKLSNYIFLLIFSLITISSSSNLCAQEDKKSLEKKRQEILKDIKFTEKLLSQTKRNIKSSFSDLIVVSKQISLRENLIQNTKAEMEAFDHQISTNQAIVKALEEDMLLLKNEYAGVIRNTYKSHRLKDRLVMILSSKNFNEAFRRINYLRKYSVYRHKQAFHIKATQKAINEKIEDIELSKKEKKVLLREQINQKKRLDKEKKTKDQIVSDLKNKQKTLSGNIKKKQRQAKKLNQQISSIIKKELEAARKKTKKNGTSTEAYKDTPEYKNLSSSFSVNQGKLPWPVEKGFVSKQFGEYRHPDLKNVKLENNGIDIKTEANIDVRAIFKGKVVSVINNPLFKNAVIINHGEYFSVYSKLKTVNVKADDEIDTKQIIGKAYTDSETNNTEIHLEIWKGSIKLNPIYWIYRK